MKILDPEFQRSKRLLRAVVSALLVCACQPAAAAGPAQPAATVIITQAQAGLLGPPAAAVAQFVPSAQLTLQDGQEFGWRMQLKTKLTQVRVREELTLPAEPRTWGDPEPGLKRRTSADGRTATTELLLVPVDGVIQFSWTVTRGDPAGTWVLKVQVEDLPVQTFRLQAK